jgi:hypothetical protein
MPATSTVGGVCMGMPDVCNVPGPAGPIPTPFPNVGTVANAECTVSTVLIQNKESVTEASSIPTSQGDEPGVAGGVVSGVNMGSVAWKRASSTVYAKGKKMVFVTAMTAHNGSNANMPTGAQVAPSQAKVFVSV